MGLQFRFGEGTTKSSVLDLGGGQRVEDFSCSNATVAVWPLGSRKGQNLHIGMNPEYLDSDPCGLSIPADILLREEPEDEEEDEKEQDGGGEDDDGDEGYSE